MYAETFQIVDAAMNVNSDASTGDNSVEDKC